jgi:hypothetical protein
MQYTLDVPLVPISANRLLRMHWKPRLDLFCEWQKAIHVLCLEQKVPKSDHITVSVTIFHASNRKRDEDNFEFSAKKMIGDSLKMFIIEDDCPQYLTWGLFEQRVDSARPRTEICLVVE